MKKLITLSVLAIAATVSAATSKGTPKSEAEYRAELDAVMAIAATNTRAAYSYTKSSGFFRLGHRKDLSALAAEADSRLASAGLFFGAIHATKNGWLLPITAGQAFAARGFATNFPNVVAVARKYGCSCTGRAVVACTAVTLDECVSMLSDYCLNLSDPERNESNASAVRNKILKLGELRVKRWLREQGVSFVTKGDVNPVADKLKGLATALNAPRFAGLNEWLESVGSEARVDTSRLPSQPELDDIRTRVLYGELNLTPTRRLILQICLGTDGYNAFVKEYNGD